MERAIFFIDGNNFYHGFISRGDGPGLRPVDYRDLDFKALAGKLAGSRRRVEEVRHYVGQVKQEGDLSKYERQRKFVSALERDGVTCRMGRLEKRGRADENTRPLAKWLAALPGRKEFDLDDRLCRELENLGRQTMSRRLGAWLNGLSPRGIRLHPQAHAELHRLRGAESGAVWVEKAVDVMIAVDMISMAHRDRYDVAYLLSADGDFTPAVDEVRGMGKKVFAASPLRGAALARHVDTFIRLKRDFFTGLWRNSASGGN